MMFNGAKSMVQNNLTKQWNSMEVPIMPIPLKMLPCIQIGFLPQLLLIFDLEADRISSLSIDPSIVESERGVVLVNVVLVLSLATVIAIHAGNWNIPTTVMGYEDDMKNWNQQDLERYFKTYYAPNNCVVVVSGAIKTEEVKRLAQKYLEPIPAQPAPPKVHIVEPVQTGERRITVQKK
jgi:predicted Zn-dependent peptidase